MEYGYSVGSNEAGIEALHAMARLNSWLRSKSGRRPVYGRPLGAVYYLKREAIIWADANLACKHGSIIVGVECRDCGGSGRYCDSYGCQHDHCWRCGSRGRTSLHFVWTWIEEAAILWHTPRDKFWIPGKHTPLYSLAVWDDRWGVNQPGLEMTVEEVARDLNIVEAFWPRRPGEHHTDWGTFDVFHYTLNLGDVERDRCAICGGEANPNYRCHVRRGWFEFSDVACKRCHDQKGIEVFNLFPFPVHIVGPHAREWAERKGRAYPEHERTGELHMVYVGAKKVTP